MRYFNREVPLLFTVIPFQSPLIHPPPPLTASSHPVTPSGLEYSTSRVYTEMPLHSCLSCQNPDSAASSSI